MSMETVDIPAIQTKQGVSEETRNQVLELRRRHSLREVANITGLPLGTVKTITSRSGLFRDNETHRALFSLPPIRESAETLPSAPTLPPQQAITGDQELDAILWLHQVVDTGQPALIDLAREAVKKIKTPAKELEKRYAQYLMATSGNSLAAVFGSFNFADIEGMAKRTIERERLRVEAAARFDDVLADTDAELFCIQVLRGLRARKGEMFLDKDKVAARFKARPELLPHTLADCLHELDYWGWMYELRNAVDCNCSEGPREVTAREWFVQGLLAEIRPRNRDEAKAVLRHLGCNDGFDRSESVAVLENLIG